VDVMKALVMSRISNEKNLWMEDFQLHHEVLEESIKPCVVYSKLFLMILTVIGHRASSGSI
jgi:hypothetical protein